MNNCVQTILFAISLIFQLSGAILLILHYFSNTRKRIAYEYFSFEGYVTELDENMEKVKIFNKDRLRDIMQGIFMNRVAFIYLLIGYAMTVVGNNKSNNVYLLAVIVIGISILLSLLTRYFIELLSKSKRIINKYFVVGQEDVAVGAIVAVVDEGND